MTPPEGADASLYGARTPEPYLVQMSRKLAVLKPDRRTLVKAPGVARAVAVHGLELASSVALVRGLAMWSIPLAWVTSAVLLAVLSILISDSER